MQGIEIARQYFEQYGEPMLKKQFPEYVSKVAAGLIGAGSECFGYDDEISRDHDFEPGFCLFLPGEDVIDRRTAFLMERAYAALPRSFMGLERGLMSPVGGNRRGVIRLSDFLSEKTGLPDGMIAKDAWFSIQEQYLLEVTNGEVFLDESGILGKVREHLSFFPRDVMLKKTAGHLLLGAQSGPYNYERCLRHGEKGSAQMCLYEYCDHMISVIFLLNGRYRPYYKWVFRAMRELPVLSTLCESFEFLLTTDNEDPTVPVKQQVLEEIQGKVIEELLEEDLSRASCTDLEKHAYSVNDRIGDPVIRNRHILSAV
ncbi:MAG: DUF4037 domain-containing protein [Clostridia bacterium]|nr:DUF4037 domain-containing protein [Clostridia bacterium]